MAARVDPAGSPVLAACCSRSRAWLAPAAGTCCVACQAADPPAPSPPGRAAPATMDATRMDCVSEQIIINFGILYSEFHQFYHYSY